MAIKRFSTKQNKQYKQKIMLVTSLLFFFATTGYSMTNMFKAAFQQPALTTETASVDPLELEAKGYELVLQREPNNQAALEGLVNTRLQMNDTVGAIEPLEKLVQLHPDREDYAELLTQVSPQAGSSANSSL